MQTALAAGVTDNLTAGVPGEGSVAGARDVPRLLVALPFVAGISLATFLFAYLVSRFIHEAIEAAATPGAGRLAVFAPGLLAVITALGGLRWTVLFTLSFAAFQRARQTARRAPSTWPLVSIFVPAYNEAENIEAAIESLLLLDYPRYEVIVVDDGSTDGTCGRAKRYAGSHGRCAIRVYRKPNGGKWSAHNFAFRRAIGELVLCLDADSRVDPLSLRRMVVHMADPQVAAVAGQIRVRNRHNVLTRLQAMEYLMGNGCARMAMSLNKTVLIVAGPLGLFRRCALEEVFLRYGRADGPLAEGQVDGPFEGDTFAEDFDLSMAVLSLGGRIVYEPAAISHTRAPDSTLGLLSQRYRWCRGTIQVLRKYFRRARVQHDLLRPGLLAWLTATYLFDLALLPIMYAVGIGMLIVVATSHIGGLVLVGWAAVALLVNLNAAAMFALLQGDSLGLLHILPLYDIYQNFLVTPAWFISIVDEVRGARMRW
ncbi:MAG: glycosyltransferase family 2 protein [Pirellulaceae bacterium]|nr:glycosyltransferase [Thermoguttaceae bacterium]MDI9446361.1 glycosyltransferase [Planctomycetota bacterium]NLZ01971.1 glycosyltransferase family 2 protein [Pirellulaceae bacterium]